METDYGSRQRRWFVSATLDQSSGGIARDNLPSFSSDKHQFTLYFCCIWMMDDWLLERFYW